MPDGNIDGYNSPAHEEPIITDTIPAETHSPTESQQADPDEDDDIIFEGISQVSEETMHILKEKHEENKKKQKKELYEESKKCAKCQPFDLCQDHTYKLAMINMKTETGFGWPSLPKEEILEKPTAADRKRKAEEVHTGSDEGKNEGKGSEEKHAEGQEINAGSDEGKNEGRGEEQDAGRDKDKAEEYEGKGEEHDPGSDKEKVDEEEEEEEGDNDKETEENNGRKSPPPPPPPPPPAPKPPLPPPQLDESRTNSGETTTSTTSSASSSISQPNAGKGKTGKIHDY